LPCSISSCRLLRRSQWRISSRALPTFCVPGRLS
jgi:hypothetical protein